MGKWRALFLSLLAAFVFSAGVLLLRFPRPVGDTAEISAKAVPETAILTGGDGEQPALELLPGEKLNINTATAEELMMLPGICQMLSQAIVAYREENGAFSTRKTLMKVPKLGNKAFEQCAGFLRVPESKEYLDRTAVHPESYTAARRLLELTGFDPKKPDRSDLSSLREKAEQAGLVHLCEQLGIGLPTLNDMIGELMKPGRDPRDELPKPLLRTDVMGIDDLTEGMVLDGTVRNVIDFGAFVDIGVHLDGLVHISEMSDRFIRHPSEVVKVGDIVSVRVMGVDKKKNIISLSMKAPKGQ